MPDAALSAFAPAKINLALHVLCRRDDGYHELESLVAFADVGDRLTLVPGNTLSLTVTGPMAPLLADGGDNLVLKAVRALLARRPELRTGAFTLEKHLPVASGIGGGSTDAAAALRLVAKANGLSLTDPDLQAAALMTGADVPVCLDAKARIMRGIGEKLDAPLALPDLPAVLVNPGIGVSTPAVFRALAAARGGNFRPEAMPPLAPCASLEQVIAFLRSTRNDLETPALALEPVIGTVSGAIAATRDCLLVRMSGSGASVFGLYPDQATAEKAAAHLTADHPDWWIRPTRFGA